VPPTRAPEEGLVLHFCNSRRQAQHQASLRSVALACNYHLPNLIRTREEGIEIISNDKPLLRELYVWE
jgi:hypothetical protein